MTKTEKRNIAKEILIESLAVAYYRLENMEYSNYTLEEIEEITSYINQYGESMAKAINRNYYTM